MQWTPAARSIWGKTSKEADAWMPLVHHLEDAAGVAAYLWDDYLPAASRSQMAASAGMSVDEMRSLVSWLAGIHDIGKATPAFAAQGWMLIPDRLDVMRDLGLDARRTVEDRSVPHGTAGQIIVSKWLAGRAPGSTRTARDTLACIVGCHHGSTPARSQVVAVEQRRAQLGFGVWDEVRDEILTSVADATGATGHLEQWAVRGIPSSVQVLVSGLVIMADWIASNTDYFPYLGRDESSPLRTSEQRLARAVGHLDLPAPWLPDAIPQSTSQFLGARFPALKGVEARPLQEALVTAARTAEDPGLFIVEGPMGVGKTEAALLAAEVLAERFGLGGVFVGLPTMATANPMFERVLEWLAQSLCVEEASVALCHGKAALNDSYTGLMGRWRGNLYDEAEPSLVVVNAWLRGRKRAGLASFVVGTIDQSLFAALKAKHVVLRHLGLVGKVVIIDEVHAADDYMREYLKTVLAWLGTYRTPVILMSATLPPAQRDELLNAYAGTRGQESLLATGMGDAYPRITTYAGTLQEVSVAEDSRTARVELARIPDDVAHLVELIKRKLTQGGCVGVICNTVARAQEAFRALQGEFGSEVVLVHSRFISTERAQKEAELVRRLGPDSGTRPSRLVVVGTQVLEQSLDVDFDMLVTDLAPADLVLQRVGRLHRHDRLNRPVPIQTPTLWLRGVEDWTATPPIAVRGSRAVYGSLRLLQAAAVLAGRDALRIPEDIPRLVRLAYEPTQAPPSGWESQWGSAEDVGYLERVKAIQRAHTYLLDPPWMKATLNGLIDVSSGDPERADEQGKSQVRDSDEGLEVMVLWRDQDGLHLPPGHPLADQQVSEGVQWGLASDERLARAMAACTLRLPAALCFPRVIERVISGLESSADYSGWQASRWISGQLAIVFDAQGCCEVGGFALTYDPQLGLQYASV